MELSGSWRAVGRISRCGNSSLGIGKQRHSGTQVRVNGEPFLHRLANLVAVAPAVMVRRRLVIIRWDLIAVACRMAEAGGDV